MPGRRRATLGRRRKHKKERIFEVEIETAASPDLAPRFAVWDLADFEANTRQIRGRACDDLIGAAAVLATLIDLKRSRALVNIVGVLSRAEEVGFRGALALAASRKLSKNSLIISLETSRELPGVKMGKGVILRVGDRASVFDPAASRFLAEVATELTANATFSFQRALMSGGTCEATAYQEFGFQCAAVCIALGNYHNCGESNRIEAEHVAVTDACGMVELLVGAARNMPQYSRLVAKLPKRLDQLLGEAQGKLRQTAARLD
jgi:endoglucanase